jgi:uncharacterized lipoprotein YmbA
MQGKPLYHAMVVTVFLAAFLTGCVNLGKGTERLPRLYLLTATAPAAEKAAGFGNTDGAIGIGPLSIPEYLNRPQLVTRAGDNELQAAAFANWAEPLKQNILRVLAENMTALTGNEAVYRYPWRVGFAPSHQLQVEVERFDADAYGEAVLSVRWEWTDQTGQPMMTRKRTVLRRRVQGSGDDAVVDAMSLLLLDYSRLTVAMLREMAS